MKRDRIMLLVAYVLLVFVTGWSAHNTKRTLDVIEEDVCATAEIVISNQIFNAVLYREQEGVDTEVLRTVLDTYIALSEAVQDRCGLIFIDKIPIPEVPVTTGG